MLEQNQMNVIRLHRSKVLSKYFNAWINARQHAGNLYGAKNKALLAIWNAKCADVKKDVRSVKKAVKTNSRLKMKPKI